MDLKKEIKEFAEDHERVIDKYIFSKISGAPKKTGINGFAVILAGVMFAAIMVLLYLGYGN